MKKNKQILVGVFVLALILVGAFFIYNSGLLQQTILPAGGSLIKYSDLTAEERLFLQPMLLGQVSGHQEVKIQGTVNQYGVVDFYSASTMSGQACSNSVPLLTYLPNEATNRGICEAGALTNFINKTGGDKIFIFKFLYANGNTQTCSNVNKNTIYSICKDTGLCYQSYPNSTYSSFHSLVTYEELPIQVSNCKYEKRTDGWYTTYDASPNYYIFCKDGQSISKNLFNYTCTNYGKSILKQATSQGIEVTTYSYTQYDSKPITFLTRLTNIDGTFVYPEKIQNMQAITTLSNGVVTSCTTIFKGNGLYETSCPVVGTGTFTGELQFDFLGDTIFTPKIVINVEKIGISIDTSKIIPSANLNEVATYTLNTYDTIGNIIIPDNLWIVVSYPDGITTKTITFNEFTRISDGKYTFNFTFPQVEKYTFDIFSDKVGLVRGTAKATVSVSGSEGYDPNLAGPSWTSNIPLIVGAGFVIFFSIIFIIYKLTKKKRK